MFMPNADVKGLAKELDAAGTEERREVLEEEDEDVFGLELDIAGRIKRREVREN
jgi:hypothetical protein